MTGPFSERMLSVFPDIEESSPPVIALVDQGAKASAGIHRITTALVKENGGYMLNPADTGGALIAAGSLPGADLTLGPSSLKNEDLVMVYDSILAQREPPFLTSPPISTKALIPTGTAYLAQDGQALIPPASQFFATRPGPRLVLPLPMSKRWPWGLLLVALAALKLVIWSRLTGHHLFVRS